MTRPLLGRAAALSLTLYFVACATAESGDAVGDGDNGSGGSTSSSTGGSIVSNTGGTNASTGGANAGSGSSTGTGSTSMGGAGSSTGGATTSTGGATTSTGGSTFEGACSDYPSVDGIRTTGEFGVFACTKSQAECTGVPIGEDALWECVDDWGNNCGQKPEDGTAWSLVDLCSNLASMGGAGGAPD